MATDPDRDTGRAFDPRVWGVGVVAGVIAGVGMGVILSVGTDLLPLIGALYGRESFWWGWAAHLLNSAVLGLAFSIAVSRPTVRPDPPTLGTYAAYGLVYGALLEVVTGGILFPLWVRASVRPELALPFFPIPGTVDRFVPAVVLGVGHLAYGVVLGTLVGAASGALSEGPAAAHGRHGGSGPSREGEP